jgi:hypothetical protein
MKAVIIQAGEVEMNGQQSATFNILSDDDVVLVSSQSVTADVEEIEDKVKALVTEFKAKYLSSKRLKEGDEIEV